VSVAGQTVDAGDAGLFGPASVTWRLHLEPVLWVGGFRALYLQALHPQVMRGTAQNSALFDPDRAWQRFKRTTEFVTTRTFGTSEEVARAGRRIRRMHARLRGHDPGTGAQCTRTQRRAFDLRRPPPSSTWAPTRSSRSVRPRPEAVAAGGSLITARVGTTGPATVAGWADTTLGGSGLLCEQPVLDLQLAALAVARPQRRRA
jgi:hypothetical protein